MKDLAYSLQKVNEKSNTEKKNGTKRLVAGHFDPAVLKQIHIIAATEDTKIQTLLTSSATPKNGSANTPFSDPQ